MKVEETLEKAVSGQVTTSDVESTAKLVKQTSVPRIIENGEVVAEHKIVEKDAEISEKQIAEHEQKKEATEKSKRRGSWFARFNKNKSK